MLNSLLYRQWQFTFLNRRALAEISRGCDLTGANIWAAFPAVKGTAIEKHFRRTLDEGTTEVFEGYFPSNSAWYEIHATPFEAGITVFFRNITEHRAATEALRERERQLETIFQQTAVGIMQRDLNNRVLMINQRYCEILGRTKEEVDGLALAEFTHPEDAVWNVPLFQQHRLNGEPFYIEKRYVRPDGSTIWCAVNVSFVKNESGAITSMITVAEDINSRKLAEDNAWDARNLLQNIVDSVEDLIFVKDREGRFSLVSRQLAEGCGLAAGQRDLDGVPPELMDVYSAADRHIMATGETFRAEDVIPIHGEPRLFQTIKVPWRRNGEIVGVIGISRDLTDRAQHEEELWEERRKLSTLMNNLPGLVYVAGVDAPWPITFISEGAETMTGYAARDFTDGRLAWADLVHPDDVKDLEAAVSEAREKQSLFSVVYRILTRTGEVRWILERGQFVYDLSGEVVSIEGLAIDVTSQKEAEERMRWVAHHDALTRLPNRVLFNEQLDEAVRMSSTANQAVGLLFLDVDHLKHVNDTLGHDAGDALLQTVAYRLQQAVAGLGIVSRIGGDEFAIVLSCLGSELELYTTIDRILESLGKPFLFSGRTVDCRASIGASVWPRHGSGAADLLKQADMALQAAKTSGRAKAMLYEPGMRAEAQRRASMLNFARRAVDEGRIEPFYQPKVLLGTGELAGFEALLRYRNRDGGILLPSTVQAAFDHPHFAVAMGQQMQERVIGDMRRWLDAGINFGHVAVNASAAEFRTGEFAEQMLERLKRASVPTSYLELEVTETVFLGRGAEYVEQALRTLHAEGVRIALDDFGTGYASLLHLKRYPVDIIKIDQSFVRDLTRKSEDAAILSSVLALGRSLSMTTVAEGIETAAQAEFLHAYGCDLGQGYLFARPDPGISVPDLVSSWSLQLYPTPNDKTKES